MRSQTVMLAGRSGRTERQDGVAMVGCLEATCMHLWAAPSGSAMVEGASVLHLPLHKWLLLSLPLLLLQRVAGGLAGRRLPVLQHAMAASWAAARGLHCARSWTGCWTSTGSWTSCPRTRR